MKKAMLLGLLCACASAGPIPTGDKPGWVSTPNGDLRFPADRFLAQTGSVKVGNEPAPELLARVDAAARAAVLARLSDAIAAQIEDKDSAPSMAQALAPAIRVEARWREGDTAYAWALLDKQPALAQQEAVVAGHEKLARDLLAQGSAAEADKPADALRAYARARTEAAAAMSGRPLVRALGGRVALELPDTPGEAERKVAALLGELTLTVADGDQQRAAEGKPLANPIVVTAWLKGKRAAGLPLAAIVPNGGRTATATVGADGKAELRVADIGKFVKNEQQIEVAVDWPALLGVPAAPAWIPKAGITAVALRKGPATTRVLVLISEKIEGAGGGSSLVDGVTAALKAAGFGEVQNGRALLDKFGADRIASMKDAELREAAKRVADVVVVGAASSGFSSSFGATTVWHTARAKLRAIDVGTGAILWQSPADEVKGKRPGEPGVAGRAALEALGEALGPGLGAALKKAAEQ